MKKVSNEEFELKYKNKDNANIIRAVTKKYSNALSQDERKTCGMYGLWKCIQGHDPKYGRKFTTSLFMHVEWECRRELSKKKRSKISLLGELDEQVPCDKTFSGGLEIFECLNEKQASMIYQRFYQNMTLEEIGRLQGFSKEAARQNINKILKHIKNNNLLV